MVSASHWLSSIKINRLSWYLTLVSAKQASSNSAQDAKSLTEHQRWLTGPAFLWQPEETWPAQPLSYGEIPDNDPEIKKQVNVLATVANDQASTSTVLTWVGTKHGVGHGVCHGVGVVNFPKTKKYLCCRLF